MTGSSLSSKFASVKPRSIRMSDADLVRQSKLSSGGTSLTVYESQDTHLNPLEWAVAHRDKVDHALKSDGGILLRGFRALDAAAFGTFVQTLAGNPVPYRERSSPRTRVSGNVYTSTEYPAHQPIFLHNENSYASVWPLRIAFLCETAAETGGATPICDVRAVFAAIPEPVRARFEEKGVLYIRNFSQNLSLSWENAFQCDDPKEVEAFCRASGYEVEWPGEGRLRTKRLGNAVRRHPQTGELVWFNHATFFHLSTLQADLRDALLAQFADEDLPNQTLYGDGTSIEADVMNCLREAYRKNTLTFPWQRGDILYLDNMLIAHGREPYHGARKVLVGMAQPVGADDPISHS